VSPHADPVADAGLEDEVRVMRTALIEAVHRFSDDATASGWLQLRCGMAGVAIDADDARDLIRRARRRGRPELRVLR
jgi:hypothetical protein